MRRLASFVPLLVLAAFLGGAGGGPPSKATPTPEAGEETPTPTPAPDPPRFLAALESSQGEGSERVAVFADGTVARATTWRGRRVTRRLTLSREELALVRRVLADALSETDEETPRSEVLTGGSERRMRLEIASPGDRPRVFLFDDATALPLAAGRARGALEDLKGRFVEKSPMGEKPWDPAGVGLGSRLRRKVDGAWFVVTRDDSFERNLEMRCEEKGLVLWLGRDQLSTHFHDPALPAPEPAPTEPPR